MRNALLCCHERRTASEHLLTPLSSQTNVIVLLMGCNDYVIVCLSSCDVTARTVTVSLVSTSRCAACVMINTEVYDCYVITVCVCLV